MADAALAQPAFRHALRADPGGETAVTVRGKGREGRNVEFLLSLVVTLNGQQGIHAIAGDTDGIDRSEDNAGAPDTPASVTRAAASDWVQRPCSTTTRVIASSVRWMISWRPARRMPMLTTFARGAPAARPNTPLMSLKTAEPSRSFSVPHPHKVRADSDRHRLSPHGRGRQAARPGSSRTMKHCPRHCFYGFGALLSLFGGWLGDKYDYRKLLFVSLVTSAITGGLLFTGLGKSLAMHIAFSFVFGAAISGMVYANLSAGIIKSVKRANASYASGLFVASLYIPAAFAGYLLGRLKESFGWTTAGILQISGCALIAAILSLVATAGRKRVAYA
jgi:hypothetical protein